MSAVRHLSEADMLRAELATLRSAHKAELARFRQEHRRERHADRQRARRAEDRAELWRVRYLRERDAPAGVLFGRLTDAAKKLP